MIDFSTRLLWLPVRWRVMIREFDPPYRFVDVQLWGPFPRWDQRHLFLEGPEQPAGGPSGTWVEERVTYNLPLGPLARVLGARRLIARMFAYREKRIRELLG